MQRLVTAVIFVIALLFVQQQLQKQQATMSEQQEQFSFMTWNILADAYAFQERYKHTNAEHLTWSYREQKIVQDILDMKPDVVCLQEVDHVSLLQHFADTYATWHEKHPSRKDGLAMLVKKSRYQIFNVWHS